MIVLPSTIVARGPPRTDVALCHRFGIRLWRSFPIDNGCETRFGESVIRQEVMQAEGFRLKAAARADDMGDIRHVILEFRQPVPSTGTTAGSCRPGSHLRVLYR